MIYIELSVEEHASIQVDQAQGCVIFNPVVQIAAFKQPVYYARFRAFFLGSERPTQPLFQLNRQSGAYRCLIMFFVLCTGRCGSVSLAKSFNYVKNYTSGHESLSHLVGSSRLNYPKRHIEVDNRLSWMLGRLHSKCGDDAFYVHLKRDRLAVAESFLKRFDRGVMAAYRSSIIMSGFKKSYCPQD
ncbi:hypothetical protein M0220_13480 [Halomonas qinghailakensis]|uniref:Uncharacterized protein n=1 Tax=Halomonas qinghailakensis TaxID=2937790 RepID=A0AA46YPV4_9GAMM|nr:hypothetical protein [Halomonas sp. ZZQ-149]UYO73880.1 hypothetical protein M0220_13480 [Halomonas sp. ZZQ-149]